MNEAKLAKHACERAVFLEKVHSMQRQGRLLFHPDDFDDMDQPTDSSESSSSSPSAFATQQARLSRPFHESTFKRELDPWDHIVQDIKGRNRVRYVGGRQIAAQIAMRLNAFWGTHAAKMDKLRAQEEKTLEKHQKTLAKRTGREVMTAWSRALLVSFDKPLLSLCAHSLNVCLSVVTLLLCSIYEPKSSKKEKRKSEGGVMNTLTISSRTRARF